ncbi:hypothetical protein [Thiocystis minor]|uniref:hypothetical protein n=1 Tax=Thiocystis minor TaxID=61597 RepID=UPI001A935610|nr:hypothetical protein [Thiocystis minor]
MARIEKRTDSTGAASYRVRIRRKGNPEHSATFSSLTRAKQWAVATEAAIQEGRYFATTEARRRTIGEMIERYVKDEMPKKKAGSRATQLQQLAWWNARIGTKSLSECSPALMVECRDALSREPIPIDSDPLSRRVVSRLHHRREGMAVDRQQPLAEGIQAQRAAWAGSLPVRS